MRPKILVTGAGLVLGQGIIRSLRWSGLEPFIICADPVEYSAGLYWGDQGYRTPFASQESYIPRIEEILATEKPDAVLLGSDIELTKMATERARLEKTYGTRVIVSSNRVVGIANDKYRTFEFLKGAGAPYPDSCLPGDEKALIERVGFPLIVKPRIGARSVGVSVVQNAEELAATLTGRSNVIIQECVGNSDTEYTAGALVFDNVCHASIVMRRELRDGNTYRAFSGQYADLNRFVRHLAGILGPYGPANFQFRLDGKGRPKVFEINSRFSGTTPLRALAGFNEVEMCLRHTLYGEPIVQPTIEDITICRHWSETVVRPSQLAALK